MMELPPELIQHTAKLVAEDPRVDDETLKACSLTFKGLTQLFQHILTSRKSEPEIVISKDYAKDLYGRKFRALLDILKANPSFARSVACVTVTITVTEDLETLIPDDSELYPVLASLTKLSSLSVGGVVSEHDLEFPPSPDEMLYWTQIPEKLRTTLECIIQAPLLQTLELRRLVVAPWSTFFGSRTNLDRLSLRIVLSDPGAGRASSISFPTPRSLAITIGHLDACQWSATSLNEAMLEPNPYREPWVHLGKIQTLEVYVTDVGLFGAEFCDLRTIVLFFTNQS